jgi:hypothetical protein
MTTSSTAPRARLRVPALHPLLHELIAGRNLAAGVMLTHVRDVPIVIGFTDHGAHDTQNATNAFAEG